MLRPKFTACLMAGGKSSRMGRDKALVEFEGEPLWLRQMRMLDALGANEMLISGRKGSAYAEAGVLIVEDQIADAGPLSGIESALEAAAHPLVLVLAVDMPWMTASYLKNLLQTCEPARGVVPKHDLLFEGLAAVYPKAARTVAMDALMSPDRSIQHFARECASRGLIKALHICEADAPLFRSVNEPSDIR